MSEQGLKRLVGALAVLVALWGVFALFGGGGQDTISASGAIADLFDEVDGPSLERLDVDGPTTSFVLERTGDTWSVSGFRADEQQVTTLLIALTSAEIGDLTATNPDNHERMGLTDLQATRVTFVAAGQARELLLGESGRRFQTSYVRLPDEDDVYLLEGDLGPQLRRALDDWRDRTVAAVDPEGVHRLVVERPEGAYTLVRSDSTWSFLEGGATAAPTVQAILTELSALEATGFYTQSDSVAQLDRASTTRAFDEAGAMLAEITVGAGENDRWARNASDAYLYRLSAFRAGRLAPARAEVAGDGEG